MSEPLLEEVCESCGDPLHSAGCLTVAGLPHAYHVVLPVAAPPEDGRPSYDELVEALRAWDAAQGALGAPVPPRSLTSEDFNRMLDAYEAASFGLRALLSRIPKEER